MNMNGVTFVDLLPKYPNIKSLPLLLPNNFTLDNNFDLIFYADQRRNTLTLVPQTAEVLREVKQPLGIVSVVGPSRTGKSYLLSRLLNSKDAFELGSKMDAQTMGIWVGTKAIQMDGYLMLLMDTEGIDHFSAEGRNDAPLVTYSLLMSTVMIYNSVGVPRNNDLEKMQFFVNLTTKIQIDLSRGNLSDEEEETDINELRQYLPKVVWVIRDCILTPVDEKGNQCTFNEYLINQVLKKGSNGNSSSAHVKRAILNAFHDIEGCIIPPPSDNPETVRSMDTVSDNQLSSEFVTQFPKAISCIYSKFGPKKIHRRQDLMMLTGETLVYMTEAYLPGLNDPNSPANMESAWQQAAKLMVKNKIIESKTKYNQDMKNEISGKLPMEETTLKDIHTRVLEVVWREFYSTLRTLSVDEEPANELKDEIATYEEVMIENENGSKTPGLICTGGLLFSFTKLNEEESQKQCLQVADSLYSQFISNLRNPHYNFDQKFEKDFETLNKEYHHRAKGPAKESVWRQVLRNWANDQENVKTLSRAQQEIAISTIENKKKEAQIKEQQIEAEKQFEEFKRNQNEQSLQAQMQLEQLRLQSEQIRIAADERKRSEDQKWQQQLMAQSQADKAMIEEYRAKSQEQMNMMMAQLQASQNQANVNMASMTEKILEIALRPPPEPKIIYQRESCFHPNTKVMLENGSIVPISTLCVGQKVASLDSYGALVMTDVYYIHTHMGVFDTITLTILSAEDKVDLCLTPSHVLFSVPEGSDRPLTSSTVTAGEVHLEDKLWVWCNKTGTITLGVVTNIFNSVFTGTLYNPLTLNDGLLAEQVFSTCFIINYQLEWVDTLPMKVLYFFSPSLMENKSFKKVVETWDSVSERLWARFTKWTKSLKSQ